MARASWKATVATHTKLSRRWPSWMRYIGNNDTVGFIEDRAEVICEMLRENIAGIGQNRLASFLLWVLVTISQTIAGYFTRVLTRTIHELE